MIDVRVANRRGTSDAAAAEGVESHRTPVEDLIDAQVSAALAQSGLEGFSDQHGDDPGGVAAPGTLTNAPATDDAVLGALNDFPADAANAGRANDAAPDGGTPLETSAIYFDETPSVGTSVFVEELSDRADELLLNADVEGGADAAAAELTLAGKDEDLYDERALDAFPSEADSSSEPAQWPPADDIVWEPPTSPDQVPDKVDDRLNPIAAAPAAWNGTIQDPWSDGATPETEWRPAVAAMPVPPPTRPSSRGAFAAATLVFAVGVGGLLLMLPVESPRPSLVAEDAPSTEQPLDPTSSGAPIEMAEPAPPAVGAREPVSAPAASIPASTLAARAEQLATRSNRPSTPVGPPVAVPPARSERRAESASTVSPSATRPGSGAAAGSRGAPVGTTGDRRDTAVAASGSPRDRSATAGVVPPPVARPTLPNNAVIAPPPTAAGTIVANTTAADTVARNDAPLAPPSPAGETTARAVAPAAAGETTARALPPVTTGETAVRTPPAAVGAEATITTAAGPESPRTSPAPPAVAPRAEAGASDGITQALKHLQVAYERRDATLAKAVWPTVNERALARAFEGLRSQSVTFDRCQMNVSGVAGEVECRGVTTYVPRVGGQYQRTESRQWKFRVQKGDERWLITSAAAR